MSKSNKNIQSPFDNIMYKLSDDISDTFYNNNFTPNEVTTLSNITWIVMLIFLYNSYNYIAAFLLLISFFFDCLNGFMARKYKMSSNFGNIYDHTSHIIKFILLMILFYKINKEKLFKILPVIIIFLILSWSYTKCEEINNNIDETSFVPISLCPASTPEGRYSYMQYVKYFGAGSLNILLAILIIYFKE
jgi:phosphatidylglycerophosphate synthase